MVRWIQLNDKEVNEIKDMITESFGVSRDYMKEWLFFMDSRGSIWLFTGDPRFLDENIDQVDIYSIGMKALIKKSGKYRITDSLDSSINIMGYI
jgi:hypothetical protein